MLIWGGHFYIYETLYNRYWAQHFIEVMVKVIQTAQRQWPWQQKIFTYFACMVRLCVCVKQIRWTTIPRDQDNGKNAFSWEQSLRTLGDNHQVHGATSAFVRMNQGREFVFALWFLTCSCHMLPYAAIAPACQSPSIIDIAVFGAAGSASIAFVIRSELPPLIADCRLSSSAPAFMDTSGKLRFYMILPSAARSGSTAQFSVSR